MIAGNGYHYHDCSTKDCDNNALCTVNYNKEKFAQCPMYDGRELCHQCEAGNIPELRDLTPSKK